MPPLISSKLLVSSRMRSWSLGISSSSMMMNKVKFPLGSSSTIVDKLIAVPPWSFGKTWCIQTVFMTVPLEPSLERLRSSSWDFGVESRMQKSNFFIGFPFGLGNITPISLISIPHLIKNR